MNVNDLRAAAALIELKHPGLLQKLKAQQWTLAHFVAAFGSAQHMAHLCAYFPHACKAITPTGLSPFMVALQYKNFETSAVLLHYFC
jgi:hypothetical protein